MKTSKSAALNDYIYIRLDDSTKEKVKEAAKKDGSNMTIWVRQLIMRELANV